MVYQDQKCAFLIKLNAVCPPLHCTDVLYCTPVDTIILQMCVDTRSRKRLRGGNWRKPYHDELLDTLQVRNCRYYYSSNLPNTLTISYPELGFAHGYTLYYR